MDTSTKKNTFVKAYPNIALVKYWGKFDKEKHLAYNSSLSISVDTIYTLSSARVIDERKDRFYLNNEIQGEKELSKIISYLDKIRNIYKINSYFEIKSINSFPTAAGLASSASGYLALAKAIDIALSLNLDDNEISALARIGSVSASRSAFGGFVALDKKSEFAYSFHSADEYSVIFIIVDSKKKTISSRIAMEDTVNNSDFYNAWLESTERDFTEIKKAIVDKNFSKIGEITENSSMKMHALMLAAKPSFTYLNGDSLKIIEKIRMIRKNSIECYFTLDAGPNVKVLVKRENSKKLLAKLREIYPDFNIILCNSSNGYEIVKGDKIDQRIR